MPTYIDESGDAGIKDGSTPYFRLAAVHFNDTSQVERLAECLVSVRAKLGLPQSYEFRFAKSAHNIRMSFFTAVAAQPFVFIACSFEKNTFDPRILSKDSVRDGTIGGLLKHLAEWYRLIEERLDPDGGLKELIVYDECDDPAFERAIRAGLKVMTAGRQRNGRLIRDIKSGKSKCDPGIQLVDMVCGAVGRHISGESGYYKLIETKAVAIEILKKQ
jgi:Protein of unknown function (DUF3800)